MVPPICSTICKWSTRILSTLETHPSRFALTFPETHSLVLKEVVAIGLEKELECLDRDDCYFNSISSELVVKRDFMVKVLSEVGMKPTVPEGGYFMVADWTPLESQIDLSSEKDKWKDYRFTKWMTKNLGLQGIPPSAFYTERDKSLAENFVRYCFFKVVKK